MLTDLHDGLNKLGDRLTASQADHAERLRAAVAEELRATRDALQALQSRLDALRNEMLAQTLEKLAEQGRADQKLIQESFSLLNKTIRQVMSDPAHPIIVVEQPRSADPLKQIKNFLTLSETMQERSESPNGQAPVSIPD